ncbi:TolC family outer membrane protein [Pseudomonas sp. 148P]|uniref:TolC family outer membrane protein n=1 Tax=Pseudomonas ulcerans TaxID=3115852 RepID=A0ABU7HQM6_9PSED|nr:MULTISPECIES: TolC family outer membrane protein [unclassified Pseudomonas]MEE1923776.1 TolC family outer membrane protein [Pseudomonas sp. 147P]MEE1933836.1 TolC family outer membrane protein [Pseudomonas sp. 148P]
MPLMLLCFALLFTVLPAPAMSAARDEGTLLFAYEMARTHDAAYAAAQLDSDVGRERYVQGRSRLLPEISLDTQLARTETEYKVVGGQLDRRGNNQSFGIQLVQPVFRWQSWIAYEQGDRQRILSEIKVSIASQDLRLRVVEAYLDFLTSMETLRALDELKVSSRQQLASAKRGYELGDASIVDVQEAQSGLDQANASFIKARSTMDIARARIEKITGRPLYGARLPARPVELELHRLGDIRDWIKMAQVGNLTVQQKEVLLSIAAGEVQSRRAEGLPVVDLVMSRSMQQSPSASTERSDASSIGLRLSMAISSGGRTSSSVREAKALHAQSEYELEDNRQAAALEVREHWLGVTDGAALVKALESSERSASSAVKSNMLGFTLGARSGMDVLEAQTNLADVRGQLSKARYETLLSYIRLKSSVGGLSDEDVVWLDDLLSDATVSSDPRGMSPTLAHGRSTPPTP